MDSTNSDKNLREIAKDSSKSETHLGEIDKNIKKLRDDNLKKQAAQSDPGNRIRVRTERPLGENFDAAGLRMVGGAAVVAGGAALRSPIPQAKAIGGAVVVGGGALVLTADVIEQFEKAEIKVRTLNEALDAYRKNLTEFRSLTDAANAGPTDSSGRALSSDKVGEAQDVALEKNQAIVDGLAATWERLAGQLGRTKKFGGNLVDPAVIEKMLDDIEAVRDALTEISATSSDPEVTRVLSRIQDFLARNAPSGSRPDLGQPLTDERIRPGFLRTGFLGGAGDDTLLGGAGFDEAEGSLLSFSGVLGELPGEFEAAREAVEDYGSETRTLNGLIDRSNLQFNEQTGLIGALRQQLPELGVDFAKVFDETTEQGRELNSVIDELGTSLFDAFSDGVFKGKELSGVLKDLAGHEVSAIDNVFLNDVEIKNSQLNGAGLVTTGRFANRLRIRKHLGSDSQAADNALVSEVGKWTVNHRLRGTAYIYLRLEFDRDAFPTGIPNVAAMVDGKKVWDPRNDPGDPSVTSFSTNAALCVLDYLVSDVGFGAALSEIHESSWTAAANLADELVALKGGGTQVRYDCNGSFQIDAKPLGIAEDLLTAMAGTFVYQQGQFRGYGAEATVASGTLDESDLRGDLRVMPQPGRSESFNAVRGNFVDADDGFLATDFPPITNATFEAEDGGERVFKEIDLPFTTNKARAQRIGNLHLLRARQGIIVEFPAKLTKFNLAPWDVVTLSIARLGWTDKEFRVLDWALSEDGGVDLTLQEEAASVYSFDPEDEITLDPAPDTDLPDPFTTPPPGAPVVSEELFTTTQSSGVKARAIVSWTAPDDVFVTNYELQFRLSGAADYVVAGETTDTTLTINDIEPGLYDFRVKAINALGVASAWATNDSREILGLGAPPAVPANLTVSAVGGLAVLRWDQAADLDVKIGGKIEFRHSPVQAGALWAQSVSIGNAVAGSETVAVLPLKTGTYLARAVDSSGIKSDAAAMVSTRAARILAFSNVDSVAEHPNFSGAHSATGVSDGKLHLGGVSLVDSFADVDTIANWDVEGGVAASGTYSFAAGIDLGAVERTRLETTLAAIIINTLDQIDDRATLVDSWDDFDGNQSGAADAEIWARETDDDPLASPVWSAWQRLDSAEYEARAFQFQARLKSEDGTHNIEISQLSIAADQTV